ncbi:MAG: fibrobacter succinogenes major paralogous domain-containing protein [Bacteroidales bacterium]|nr:fibrobacter succinogenes major paralogous domain-containing protein [Bacteroidales bacterium]
MKTAYVILFSFTLAFWLVAGCDKGEDDDETVINYPNLSISYPGSITTSSFEVEVEIKTDGGSPVTDRGICFSTQENPTIDDEKISKGSGTGTFTVKTEGLTANTCYYVLGFATNSKGTSYSNKQYMAVTSFGTIADFEGNTYQTVKIGSQEWMRENLKSKKYDDGSDISGVSPAGGSEDNDDQYGRLYNWYAVMRGAPGSNENPSMVQGVCPSGFHIPSDAEWKELEMFLGMSKEEADLGESYRGNIAGKLKVPLYWQPTPTKGDNSTGFSALPAGYREIDGSYQFNDYFWGSFYSSTEAIDTSKTVQRYLTGDDNGIWRVTDNKKYGLSVRCVRDE